MQQANWINELCALSSPHRFGQDAVFWAVMSGFIVPKYENLDADLRLIHGIPGESFGRYDEICEAYRRSCRNADVIEEATQVHTSTHTDRKSTRLNSSHIQKSRMPSSA